MMLRGCVTLFLVSLGLAAWAQSLSLKQYKVGTGLPTEMVKAITEDSIGNLWIATDEGFVKYNAARFEALHHVTHSNYTKGFYHTRSGRLLAFGDLDLLELESVGDSSIFRSIVPVSTNVNDSSLTYPKLLYEDGDGVLWVSESQSVVKLGNSTLKRYPFGLADRTPQFLRSFTFFEDGNRDLFAVSVAGNVFQFNRDKDQFELAELKFPSQVEFVKVIDNRLLIGAIDGLYVCDMVWDGRFSGPRLALPIPSVSYVELLPDKSFFVATRGANHFLVDSTLTRSRLAVSGIHDVNHVYVSQEGDIWLSTSEGIVLLQEPAFLGPMGTADVYIESVVEDVRTSVIYYATRDELHSFDPNTQEDKLLVKSIPNSYFQSLLSTQKGIWAANAFQVLLVSGDRVVKSFDFSDQRMFVTSLDKDSEENIWITIPGRRGVLMIDNNLELHEFDVPLAHDGFINAVRDGGNGIYVTSKGLGYLFFKGHGETTFKNISLPLSLRAHEELNTFGLFVKGPVVWLATSLGLMRYDFQKIQRVDIGKSFNGLPVRSISANAKDGFVMATPRELLYYNLVSGDCQLFASAMNLSGLTVNSRSLCIARDSRVWLGTSRGVFVSSHHLNDNIKTPRPRLAYADVDGKRISSLGIQTFPYNILLSLSVTSVTFPEEERVFEFRRSADQPWRRVSGTSIDLVTSNPGMQDVQVRARKTGAYEWSEITDLRFYVARPFWMTFWFYALIVLAVGAIVMLTVMVVRMRNARQKMVLEALVADRTAQLAETNRELEGFSYSVSHDLRAPLRAILTFSHALDEDYQSQLDEEGRRNISTIVRNANKMNQLIDDLLRFSKALHKEINRGPVNLNQMVSEVIQLVRESGGYLTTVVNLHPLPTVMADRGLLSQVWQNLVSNAMKYSSKATRPQVDISCEESEKEYLFCVKDNGAGFDMRYAEKLFGVFQRLHPDKEFPGTGIGLALVKRIVVRHGGRIWAAGKVDEGASFYFTLPRTAIPN